MSLLQTEQEVLINTRAGGVYIPPSRLKLLQQKITDKSSAEYQRITWDALKKSINGLINKVNTSNIKNIVFELINENLIRGRGLFARSIMKAQAASPPFTPVYAALVAIINTKLPQIGELVLTRLIVQFRKAYRRNDKTTCLATTTFIAHLCNHLVAHEIVALQILVLLLESPTSDSVEVAVGFIRECGAHLAEVSPKANNDVFDRFRAILHEANVEKRVQYMIEVLFQVRKDKYKDNPPIAPDLDLVKEDDQITHHLSLDDELDVEETL
ncbi:13729_t:CDS:2, partial [Gigaspora margarita]